MVTTNLILNYKIMVIKILNLFFIFITYYGHKIYYNNKYNYDVVKIKS